MISKEFAATEDTVKVQNKYLIAMKISQTLLKNHLMSLDIDFFGYNAIRSNANIKVSIEYVLMAIKSNFFFFS